MNWAGKRVLVTGAGGFIGSHLTERLVMVGAKTRALVHYRSDGSSGWLDVASCKEDMEIIAGDVCDQEAVRSALQGVDIVFHLAALIGIPYSYHAPLSYVRTNAEGTVNVLQAAREKGVQLVVHTSTSEVYGTARYVPIDENHPLQGQSPYSASKIAGDKIVEAFYLSFGLPVTIIRPFNTYGPRQSGRAVIPTIICQALTRPRVQLGNLEPTRDFNYIADTVEGFMRIADCPEAIGQVINIGSGQEISIRQLAGMIVNLLGTDIPIRCAQERVRPDRSEVDRLCADNTKAHEILGWRPRYMLKQGLEETLEWTRGHLERYRPQVYAI